MKQFKEIYQGQLNLQQLQKDETIFHVANGYLGKKAVFSEGYGFTHKRGVYVNGFYNTYPYHYEENATQFPQFGKTIVALPDASLLTFRINNIGLNQKEMEHVYTERIFDLEKGLTLRKTTYLSPTNQQFLIEETVYAHQQAFQHIHIQVSVTSLTEDVTCDIKHFITMPYIQESNVRDPRVAYEKQHIKHLLTDLKHQEYHVETLSKQFQCVLGYETNVMMQYNVEEDNVIGTYSCELKKNVAQTIDLHLSYRCNHIEIQDLDEHDFNTHLDAMSSFWKHNIIQFEHQDMQHIMDYHMYQLYHAGGIDNKLSIAAKGLSGEGYEGHYFWDTEIYMLPFFIFNFPHKAKTLLEHRMLFLNEAREEALNMHVKRGIKIPWRSIDGTETSPYFLAGSAQLHINSDVAYAMIMYVETTGDTSILINGGFRFLVELALYIYDYGFFNDTGFHLMNVTGPDEYTTLVDDNYYTNQMAVFHFQYILKHFKDYHRLVDDLISEEDIKNLRKAHDTMCVHYDQNLHLYLQDASHHTRKPLEAGILPNHGAPLMLKYHPHFIYRHQVLKQADSVAADILLNKYDTFFKNGFHYYLNMTSHDSSLSKCMYGIGAFQLGEEKIAETFFKDTLYLDIEDHKSHTKNGLHMANIGGSYLMVLKGIFGVHTFERLSLSPTPLTSTKGVSISFFYHNIRVNIKLLEHTFNVTVSSPLKVKVYDHEYDIQDVMTFNKRSVS